MINNAANWHPKGVLMTINTGATIIPKKLLACEISRALFSAMTATVPDRRIAYLAAAEGRAMMPVSAVSASGTTR